MTASRPAEPEGEEPNRPERSHKAYGGKMGVGLAAAAHQLSSVCSSAYRRSTWHAAQPAAFSSTGAYLKKWASTGSP